MEPSRKQQVQYFAPLIGIIVGALIGWFAMYSSQVNDPHATTVTAKEWVGRFQAITNSLIMWSLFTTTLQDRQIFGGGMLARQSPMPRGIWLVCMAIFFFWAISIIAFVTNQITIFFISSLCMLAILVGEVGWDDPTYLLKLGAGVSK
ncbi:hypothetical protein K3217_22975 [bacterium BD-1]|nr:hypothetical protein [Ottowia caeni]